MTASLRDWLKEYPAAMLEAIADGWHISLTDEQLPEIIDRLVAEMTQPQSVQAVLQRLSDEERAALSFVAAHEQLKAHVLTRRYGQVRRIGAGRLEWEAAWRQPASVAERLWFLGLIYRTYAVDAQYHGEVFSVPPEIRRVLPVTDVTQPAFHVQPAAEPGLVRDERDALARDLFVVLAHLRNHDVRASQGVLAKHELDRIRDRLTRTDPRRLLLLWRLGEQAGFWRREDRTWRPMQQAAQWLKADALSRQRVLYQTWLADAGWDELCAMPSVICEDTGWRHDPVLPRMALVDHLAGCPSGVWLDIDSLVDAIYETDPDFLRPDGDYRSWYIRDADEGGYLVGFDSWTKVEGALIRYLLGHALCWLGAVALGGDRGAERPRACRLTSMGVGLVSGKVAPLSNEDPSPTEQPLQRFVLSSDLSLVVPATASWYDRFLVERFARWVADGEAGTRYVIDSRSVARAVRRGVTISQIEAFLERATGSRLPSQVQRALRAWRA